MSPAQPAASPWQPRAGVVPLRAWAAGETARLARMLQDAWISWAHDWGVGEAADAAVACGDAAITPAPEDAWTGLGQGPAGAAWTCAAPDADVQLARALFGAADATTPVVREVVAACRADAQARLASALQLAPCAGECLPPASATWQPWSGALLATLPLGPRVLLDAQLVRSLLPPLARPETEALPPLVPLHRAAAALSLPLQVRLGGCEVEIGRLQDLRPGDVVRLPHALEAPAAVVGRDGRPLFGGYLVRKRGRKAVELAPASQVAATVPEETP